ncbi:MFS transporter [Dehalococcoidia bacterium]|nr:MFS transporter [Dehalococcoidia bacterium]
MISVLKSQFGARLRFLSVLRYRDYRLYYQGSWSSILGFQILLFAQGWLAYELTGSAVYIGIVGTAQAIPSIILSLFGGALADRIQLQRLISITHIAAASVMFILATLVITRQVEIWHIVAASFLIGSLNAFSQPALRSLWPHLINRSEFLSAAALTSSVWGGANIIGPALGGVILSIAGGDIFGAGMSFYIVFVAYLIMAWAMLQIRMPFITRATDGNLLQSVWGGMKYIMSRRTIGFIIAISYLNGYFGLSFMLLMPVFAKDILGVGPSGLGVLVSASGVGGLIGTIALASLGESAPRWALMLWGSLFLGITIVAFAFSPWFTLSVILVGVAGAMTSVYNVSVMTTMQLLLPDEFRGRVTAIRGLSWSLMPLGSLQAGAFATLMSPRFAVAFGGCVVIGFALFALATPSIRRMLVQSMGKPNATA